MEVVVGEKAMSDIHGVWFGGGPLSPLAEDCISTWPEEFNLWSRAQLSSVVPWVAEIGYFQEAWQRNHWAGASDVARLALLYQLGGIYLDVDVQVVQPGTLLAFYEDCKKTGHMMVGAEDEDWLCGAVIIAPAQNPTIGALLDYYRDIKFSDTFEGTTTGSTIITDVVRRTRNRNVHVLPPPVFYPWHWKEKDMSAQEKAERIVSVQQVFPQNAVCAHHWEGSWVK